MFQKVTKALQNFNTTEPGSVIWQYSFFILIAVALPNTPFLAVANYFDLFRPLVNFDYIVSAILMAAGYRALSFVVLLAALHYDIFTIIPQIFPAIVEPSHLFELARFIFMAPLSYIVSIALTLVVMALLVLVFHTFSKRADLKTGLVVVNIFLFVYLFYIIFMPGFTPSLSKGIRDGRLVASQSMNYFQYSEVLSYKALDPVAGSNRPHVKYLGELAKWTRVPNEEFPERALLIVNESWGSAFDPEVNKALLSPILGSGGGLIDIKYGNVVSVSGTLQAELRELCALRRVLLKKSEGKFVDEFDNCLPKRLLSDGYTTFAMHGATGGMYDRDKWYPLVGFNKQTFYETKEWPRKCKSFPGACDVDMVGEVKDFFSEPGKRFMYWLSLNTHAWYDLDDLQNDVFNCSEMHIAKHTATCRNAKLQAQFFDALAELANDPKMAGVRVRVIGDHPPPIASKSERYRYFNENSIGWLEFTIPDHKKNSHSASKAEIRSAANTNN